MYILYIVNTYVCICIYRYSTFIYLGAASMALAYLVISIGEGCSHLQSLMLPLVGRRECPTTGGSLGTKAGVEALILVSYYYDFVMHITADIRRRTRCKVFPCIVFFCTFYIPNITIQNIQNIQNMNYGILVYNKIKKNTYIYSFGFSF